MSRKRDIAPWVADYTGIPFADGGRDRHGIDCWGLMRLVLAERFGVDIPSYDAAYFHTRDFAAMQRIFDEQAKAGCWSEIEGGRESPGDVVLMRIDGMPLHVGVVVGPGVMLHARDASQSATERYDGIAWKNRVLGFYRHASKPQD